MKKIADFLFGRHPQYFRDQEETRAAVELVLAKPEQVKNLNGNLSFVGFDEEDGSIFRIEIREKITGRDNHIRSVFRIDAKDYEKVKLAPPRVLQPSKTALPNGRAATMTLASFLRYDRADSQKVKSENEKNRRFSISPVPDLIRLFLPATIWTSIKLPKVSRMPGPY